MKDTLKDIKQKRLDLDKLYKNLECSFLIKSIWPSAFDYPGVTSFFGGNLYKPDEMTFTIKNIKYSKTFHIKYVPIKLIKRQINLQLNNLTSNYVGLQWKNVLKYCETNHKLIKERNKNEK